MPVEGAFPVAPQGSSNDNLDQYGSALRRGLVRKDESILGHISQDAPGVETPARNLMIPRVTKSRPHRELVEEQ